MEHPEGFVVQGEEDKVYLLKKFLNDLKQAPSVSYNKINDHLLSIGFVKSLSESTFYVIHKRNNSLIISLYVDDLIVTGDDTMVVDEFKEEIM